MIDTQIIETKQQLRNLIDLGKITTAISIDGNIVTVIDNGGYNWVEDPQLSKKRSHLMFHRFDKPTVTISYHKLCTRLPFTYQDGYGYLVTIDKIYGGYRGATRF